MALTGLLLPFGYMQYWLYLERNPINFCDFEEFLSYFVAFQKFREQLTKFQIADGTI
jgi:hypothetical protein